MSIPDLVLASVEYLPYSGRACAGVVISGSAGVIAHHHEVAADDGQHQTKGESQHGISLAMMWKEQIRQTSLAEAAQTSLMKPRAQSVWSEHKTEAKGALGGGVFFPRLASYPVPQYIFHHKTTNHNSEQTTVGISMCPPASKGLSKDHKGPNNQIKKPEILPEISGP